ncbi:MAG: hypothetical protein NWQ09_10530, partial [Nonlabens sp.]|nr:hypothetical protein [Nonlabens sp.]
QVAFLYERSGTGPLTGTLRSSADNYSTDLAAFSGLGASDTRTINISTINNFTGVLTFRLYLYGNSNAAGTAGFEGTGSDLIIRGIAN